MVDEHPLESGVRHECDPVTGTHPGRHEALGHLPDRLDRIAHGYVDELIAISSGSEGRVGFGPGTVEQDSEPIGGPLTDLDSCLEGLMLITSVRLLVGVDSSMLRRGDACQGLST